MLLIHNFISLSLIPQGFSPNIYISPTSFYFIVNIISFSNLSSYIVWFISSSLFLSSIYSVQNSNKLINFPSLSKNIYQHLIVIFDFFPYFFQYYNLFYFKANYHQQNIFPIYLSLIFLPLIHTTSMNPPTLRFSYPY